MQPQEKLKSQKPENQQDSTQNRLDETCRRLLKNLDHYAETSTLVTAQKAKELGALDDNSKERYNIIDYRAKGGVYHLRDIIPDQYKIFDLNTLKTSKR